MVARALSMAPSGGARHQGFKKGLFSFFLAASYSTPPCEPSEDHSKTKFASDVDLIKSQ